MEYARFQGIESYEIELITDFFVGLEMMRETPGALIQCSAHPKVHEITEKYWTEVFVVDTFIYPTKHLVLLSRREVEEPRSLGIVPATKGLVWISPNGKRSWMSPQSHSVQKAYCAATTTPA